MIPNNQYQQYIQFQQQANQLQQFQPPNNIPQYNYQHQYINPSQPPPIQPPYGYISYQQPPIMQQQMPYILPQEEPKQQQVVPPKYGQANDLPVYGSQKFFTGEKVAIGEVVDKNIVIKNFRLLESKFKTQTKNCGMFQFSYVRSRNQNIYDLPDYIFISGSKILQEQMEKYESYIPFYTKLIFVKNRYYSFDLVNFNDKD